VIDAWRRALELNPNIKKNLPFYLGVSLEQTGEAGEAFTAYLRAIKNGVMQSQALAKARGILNDPENLDACLKHLKTKPDLNRVAFTTFASVGRTAEALPLLTEFSAGKPEDTSLAMKVAALQAWFGKDAEQTATSRRMLEWAAGTDKSAAAERVAKLTCLRPVEDARMREAALTLARRAVELGKGVKKTQPWFKLTLGMAEYRSGQHEQAATTLAAATTTASDVGKSGRASIEGTANFYLTMCLFQQGKPDEARALFTTTEAKMKPLPADEKNPLADKANHDDLILWLAYKEAKALLAEPGTPEK
jgi:tetratricopeptide (TPR) repeat protein